MTLPTKRFGILLKSVAHIKKTFRHSFRRQIDSHITSVCKNRKTKTNKQKNRPKTSCFWQNKLSTYPRSQNLAIILSSKIALEMFKH